MLAHTCDASIWDQKRENHEFEATWDNLPRTHLRNKRKPAVACLLPFPLLMFHFPADSLCLTLLRLEFIAKFCISWLPLWSSPSDPVVTGFLSVIFSISLPASASVLASQANENSVSRPMLIEPARLGPCMVFHFLCFLSLESWFL